MRLLRGLRTIVPVFAILLLGANANAQVQTQTSTTSGASTHEVKVQQAEVVLVDGNDLVVKLPDGSLRHFPNVPESARATVDGREVGIHDLKPGMILQRTIVTTTTPKTITTVKSVTGTVWHVNPPTSVILTLENGQNQSFKIPQGQKFNVDGQMLDAFGLKKGMKIVATKIVEEPVVVVSQKKSVTGTMPSPPTPPPADVPILVAVSTPTAESGSAAETPAAKLPKTASELPLVGLLGVLCVGLSLVLRLIRN